nr:hypothetical protein [Candidatus Cloacimonadota bacterium]
MKKQYIIMVLICLLGSIALAQDYRTSIMDFENPGSRRIRQIGDARHWFYRSLPEKTMTIKTEGVERIQLRSFSIEDLRKPHLYIIINGERTRYDLQLDEQLNGYYIYKDIEFDIPQGTESIEVLCYQRSIYMRPYKMSLVKPKPAVVHKPNRQIHAHAGIIDVTHNNITREYYTFNPTQPFKFTHNNGRNAIVYVRARLTDRTLPVFSVYHNGEKVETVTFSLARSTKYSAQGVRYLTIGKKIELPDNPDSSDYELRAESDHMFMARPVFIRE